MKYDRIPSEYDDIRSVFLYYLSVAAEIVEHLAASVKGLHEICKLLRVYGSIEIEEEAEFKITADYGTALQLGHIDAHYR